MPSQAEESILTTAGREAIEWMVDIATDISADFEVPFGRQRVGVRAIRQAVRRAVQGEVEAMSLLEDWGQEVGHQDDEPVPCELCRQVNYVINESPPEGASHAY